MMAFISEVLKKTCCSPIYSFFKSDVKLEYIDGQPCHFFHCSAHKCKTKIGGVQRFQDSQDKASTANLRQHARKCFGDEAMKQVMAGDSATERSGSIFSAFACQGQQPVRPSNWVHSNPEVCIYLV